MADINELVAEIQRNSLAALPPDQTLKAQIASHVVVTEAHNAYLAATAGALAGPLPLSSSMSHSASSRSRNEQPDYPNCWQKEASRTLYVGSLERKIKEDMLRNRFARFGHIIEVDIKNRESPSPFAFIQFADIGSVVKVIQEFQHNRTGMLGAKNERLKFKVNNKRTIINKISDQLGETYTHIKVMDRSSTSIMQRGIFKINAESCSYTTRYFVRCTL